MPDQHSEMVPPWEQFPTYERYSIGWRMGPGENYLHNWYAFIEGLPGERDSRFNYLKRHRPAPITWCDAIHAVLYPTVKSEQKFGCSRAEIHALLESGLVEHDAAYHTWLNQQSALVWPWSWLGSDTPQKAARYRTREFWFFSRHLNAARKSGNLELNKIPDPWRRFEVQLLTGELGDIDPTEGLATLGQMLCAGSVKLPWALGLSPDDFANSLAMDMGYTDAFRLWLMCAFDDDLLLRDMLQKTQVPDEWAYWVFKHITFSI